MKKTFTLTCLILASIIGAGFASGKEIQVFFSKFGVVSYLLVLLVFILFYLSIKLYLTFGIKFKPQTFFNANKMLMGKHSKLFNVFILVCYFIVLAGMFAGVYEVYLTLFSNTFSVILTILTAVLAVFEIMGGVGAINKINNLFIPITMLVLIISAIIKLNGTNQTSLLITLPNLLSGVLSAFSYVGINILLSGSILLTEGKNYTKKQINISALISSAILCLIILLFNIVLQNNNVASGLPMLTLSFNVNYVWGIVVLVCIWFSIFSAITSVTYVLSTSISKSTTNFSVCAFGVVVLGYIISLFGFSKIVEYLYPIIGAVGIVFSFVIVKKLIKCKLLCKNAKNNLKKHKNSTLS